MLLATGFGPGKRLAEPLAVYWCGRVDHASLADRSCKKEASPEAAVARIAKVGRRNDGATGRGATEFEPGVGPPGEIQCTSRKGDRTPLFWRAFDRRNRG